MSDHGTRAGHLRGCRCITCKRAYNQYMREYRLLRAEQGPPPGVHGTNKGYAQWECRCDACKLASKAYRMGRKFDKELDKA